MNIYNSEGYLDPTAYEAISNIEKAKKKIRKSINKITTGETTDDRKKMLCR